VIEFKIVCAISKSDHGLAAVRATKIGIVIAILQTALAHLAREYAIFNLLKGSSLNPDPSALRALKRWHPVALVGLKFNVVSWTLHSSYPSGA